MARRGGSIEVDVGDHAFRVRAFGRLLTVPFISAPEDGEDEADVLVGLDEIEHWDPPHEAIQIELEELAKILDAIEGECERRRLAVAFE
ncbi:MAG: Imm74 family immunity protein [Methylocystis sp.]